MFAGRGRLAHIAGTMKERFSIGLLAAALFVGSAFVSGCQGESPIAHTDVAVPGSSVADPAARAQALIEAGNEAYAAGDYELAARRFGAAAVVRDDDPAAYFGLGMSLSKIGRDDDARVAYSRARRLVQEQRKGEDEASPQSEGETP